MEDTKSFDSDLQMFRETPRAADMVHLCFLRWLIEQGRLEHLPAGAPCGELAEAMAVDGLLAEAAG